MLPDRIIAGLLAFALAWFPPLAFAQSQILGFPPGMFQNKAAMDGAVASYTGPGDVAGLTGTWTVFYSCGRVLKASLANTSTNLCVIADVGTGAITCTLRASPTGFVDLTSSYCAAGTLTPTAFCTAHTSCVVSTMYDQSGNGNNVVQATLAAMPPITFSAQNGLPCLTASGTGTTIGLPTAGSVTQAAPFAIEAVAERTANTTTVQRIIQNLTGGPTYMGFRGAANSIAISLGTQLQSSSGTPDNSFLAVIGNLDINANSDSVLVANGSIVAGPTASGTSSLSGTISVDGAIGIAAPVNGPLCEVGMYPAFLNSTQYGALTTNMRSSTNGWNF